MNIVSMIASILARQTLFGSVRNLFRKYDQKTELEYLESLDTSQMTAFEKRQNANQISRIKTRQQTSTNPKMLFLLVIVGLLVLFVAYKYK